MAEKGAIKAIDKASVHRITSGQVVIDLQTAVKELVENSLDAGATNIEVRFKKHGLMSIEVIDNGSGIPEQYHDSIALKHYTSKLSKFSDLTTVRTFGFRGEALSSLCALSEAFIVNTSTEPPMGVSLEMDASGKVAKRSKIARQRGTTVSVANLFKPLPVRRKEFERNVKREFGKALGLLNAYALIGTGVRFTVNNTADKGQKAVQLRTTGALSSRAVVAELWGPKALENIVDLDLMFEVERNKTSLKRISGHNGDLDSITVFVKGLVSKFSVGGGRSGTDRQFFYVNGRPCNMNKIQKAFNEVYRSFNANQAPFILADFIIPTDSCDINISPDKRTIFLSSENNIIIKLKTCLEETFAPSRSMYDVGTPQTQRPMMQTTLPVRPSTQKRTRSDSNQEQGGGRDEDEEEPGSSKKRMIRRSSSTSTSKQGTSASTGKERSVSPLLISPYPTKSTASQPSLGGRSSTDNLSDCAPSPASSPAAQTCRTKSSSLPPPSHRLPAEVADEHQTDDTAEVDEHDAMSVNRDLELSSDHPHHDDTPVTLDTSGAAWNRPAPSQTGTPVNKGISLQRQVGKSDLLLRSARGGVDKGKMSPATTKAKAKVRQDDLRSRLAGFARTGSQVPSVAEPEEDEDLDDGEDEEALSDAQLDEKDELDLSDDLPPEKSVSSIPKPLLLDEGQEKSTPTSSSVNVDLDPDVGHSSRAIDLTMSDDGFDDSHIPSMVDESSSMLHHEEAVSRPEVLRTANIESGDITLRFDIAKISRTWRILELEAESTMSTEADPASAPHVPSAAGVSNMGNDESAAKALARIIDKKDFTTMDIIGQFNLGFIVTRRRKAVNDDEFAGTVMDDLFIVDQHAADEKYNFETLQQTTVINSQKLFNVAMLISFGRPQSIELTASDELVALENMDVLRQNGFEVEKIEGDDDLRQGARLQLVAQPVSKSTTFDMKGITSLVHVPLLRFD
ncbi:hypothetical protein C0995_016557 [Termitomyces sp. Mi166|nr:hypothetical protein C0995_016557 [Termitomyces sp. Mi166\